MSGPLTVLPVTGMPEIGEDDDLALLIADAADACGVELVSGDVVVVSSKIVAKAEGRLRDYRSHAEAVEGEALALVAHRMTPRGRTVIARSRSGPVLAAAGVDASNVPGESVLPLPRDPDASARALRSALGRLTGASVAVVVTDTMGRPWREGQTDAAVGAAGLEVLDDLRGRTDREGRTLDVTVRAVADEVAAAADLVKGKLDGVPVAIVRGLTTELLRADAAGASSLVRHGDADWFRWGSLEAVEDALGSPVGQVSAAPAGRIPWDVAARRSWDLAVGPRGRHPGLSSPGDVTVALPESDASTVRLHSPGPLADGALAGLAVLVERMLVALAGHGHPAIAMWNAGDGAVTVEIHTTDA